ncbi:hypothetical protein ASD78_17780 [Lysobacter sp. Root667]|uniref:hypothetical protein n=1 Tax=Lysobacter sp. Root667 TaxID=1736581 RepID=UPI00070130D9|nr:hypothetical protein [Lysobacter sp. Root667]KRA70686.1 hypothetical protein ASD78_17780 [Lysobacter sp. Root667]
MFPARIGDLEAFSFSQEDHDALRRDRLGKIFGYNARPYRTALTVYLMDKSRSASVEEEFKGAESGIMAAHPGAKVAMRNVAQIVLAGQPAPGQLGLYLWTKDGQDTGSVLWIGESPSRIVKVRLSFVRPKPEDQAAAAMQYAMNALGDAAKHICEPASSGVSDAPKKPSPSEAS